MPSNAGGSALPLLATLSAMACFQIGAACAKSLFPAIGPQGAAALRLALGALMLLVIVRPWRAWPRRAPLLALFSLGAATAGAVLMFYLAQSRLPLGIAIALQFLGPLAVAIVSTRRPTDLIWAALAAAGVWWLVGSGARASAIDLVGVAFALCAAIAWAAYILCGRIASAAFGGSTGALAASIAAVLVLPFGVAQAGTALFSPALLHTVSKHSYVYQLSQPTQFEIHEPGRPFITRAKLGSQAGLLGAAMVSLAAKASGCLDTHLVL